MEHQIFPSASQRNPSVKPGIPGTAYLIQLKLLVGRSLIGTFGTEQTNKTNIDPTIKMDILSGICKLCPDLLILITRHGNDE